VSSLDFSPRLEAESMNDEDVFEAGLLSILAMRPIECVARPRTDLKTKQIKSYYKACPGRGVKSESLILYNFVITLLLSHSESPQMKNFENN
jgi:hypothetical protein